MTERDTAARRPDLAARSAGRPDPRRELTIIRETAPSPKRGVTLETLGPQNLGVSKERVRQIEHQALRKLRSFP